MRKLTPVKVIAGQFQGKTGVVQSMWPVTYLDFKFSGGAETSTEVPSRHNSLVYVYKGALRVNGVSCAENSTIVLENTEDAETVSLENSGGEAGAILLSGLPIGEKVASYGPFVMNTNEQISETFQDLANFRNGFEDAREWESQIQHLRNK